MRSSFYSATIAFFLLLVPAALGAQDPDRETPAWAQADAPYRMLFVEIGGAGFFYTVNAQLRIGRAWSRLGVGYAVDEDGDRFWSVPLMLSTLTGGDGPHYGELGAGVVLADLNEPEPVFYGAADIGYRFVHPETGLTLRATWTPHWTWDFDWANPLWAGFSVGKTF